MERSHTVEDLGIERLKKYNASISQRQVGKACEATKSFGASGWGKANIDADMSAGRELEVV